MTAAGPLAGLKVLDLTRLAPGPLCTMLLADLGADVVRVEEPGPPGGRRAREAGGTAHETLWPAGFVSSPHNALARNKRSLGLNLKTQAGREVFLRLAQRADVVVEEFRPGVARRFGIDYDTLSARNPPLVYCALSGYGQNGPYRELAGHDLNYIGQAGALSLIGRGAGPPAIPHNLIADYAGGGLVAAVAVLAALLARQKSGRGQYVDVAMADGAMLLLAQALSTFFATGAAPTRGEGLLDGGAPFYDVYLTADDKYLTVAALEPWFFANLCRALGRNDLIEHQANRAMWPEMRRAFAEILRGKPRDEWFEQLRKSDVCVGRMLTLDELESDRQVRAREMIVELTTPAGERVKQVGVAPKLAQTPGSIRSLAPALGQHTDEILDALGYSAETIARWREEGAIK